MKIWNDGEVGSLFLEVEKCKKNNIPLGKAFEKHAQNFKRKPNSVRNYYYHEIDNLSEDTKRCKRIGIDLSKHQKTHFQSFDKIQEEELYEKIEKMVAEGISVRSACLKISGGDLTVMTRIQNKYQNMKNKIKQKGNIIPFKVKQKTLSESEINSLFLGLVRLIKKNAMEQVRESVVESNECFKNTFIKLKQREQEINQLEQDYKKLEEENKMLKNKLQENKTRAVERHISSKRATTNAERTLL